MKKVYKYRNSTIEILIPNENYVTNLQTSTEIFIRKVLKERRNNGNSDTSRNIDKE